jgi:serine protease DegS
MRDTSVRQYAIFIGASVASGVLIALLLMWLWPGLITPGDGVSAARPAADEQAPGIATATAAAGTRAGLLAQSESGSFAPAVRRSAPAVVSLYTRMVEPAGPASAAAAGTSRPRYLEGLGSGVIVDAAGHIVTNQHVVRNSQQIRVQLADGREAGAQLVGSDPDTDLAVLKIELAQLPVMQMGSSSTLVVGDVVLAIGNPLGLAQTVTAGIVSAIGRAELGVATFEDFIQTDAAINDGNSGGALVNARGELVGINTAVLGRNLDAEGISVAIPVDLVRGVMREILETGRVTRGWLGLALEDVTAEIARDEGLAHGGVVISHLELESPALAAGLKRGDILESLDGSPVRSARDALARIAGREPGSTVTLNATRGRQRLSVDLVVSDSSLR